MGFAYARPLLRLQKLCLGEGAAGIQQDFSQPVYLGLSTH